MQTTTFTFAPANYHPNVIVNIFEKLEDITGVKEIRRPSATRIEVDVKSRRTMRKVMHRLSREFQTMRMVVTVPQKDRKYNPYF